MAGALRLDRAGVSEARQGSCPDRSGADAAHLLPAAMVQPVGSRGGRALYDSPTMRRFVGIDLGREPVPDETTICKFRHLLERHELGSALFGRVHEYLEQHGLKLCTGTIVDATIIHAPSSTKNAAEARDPEMHQTKKGNQWYSG